MRCVVKRLKKIIISLFIIFLISFIIVQGIVIYEGTKNEEKKVYYIVTLGARLYGRTPSESLMERLNTTLDYAKKYKDTKIIVCGGQGLDEDIPEAEAMEYFLINRGIDKNRIIKEESSTSTFENLKNAKEIIERLDDRDDIEIGIVTSDYHIYRSKLIAKRLGFKVIGLPSKTPTILIPRSYFREYFAIIKSIILDRV